MRRYRSRRGGSRIGNVIQSYKKVLNFAPVSTAAAAVTNFSASVGQDSVAAGQTTVTDPNVPTGSLIKYIEVQLALQNLVNIAGFAHVVMQRIESGQTRVVPNAVGGNPQRNQVLHQELFCVGQNQNVNRTLRFKVPPKFQRVKEGSQWQYTLTCDVIHTPACQIIYKFYR